MKNKTCFSCKPSKRKLIVTASLSIALFYSLQTTPVLAENSTSADPVTPITTSDNQGNNVTDASTSPTESNDIDETKTPVEPETPEKTEDPAKTEDPTEPENPGIAKEAPKITGWKIENGQSHYYAEDGTLSTSQWIKDDQGWHYVDATGSAVKGWYTTPNGKTWYFDPSDPHHPAIIGDTEINGKSYYFDEGYGLLRNGWVHRADGSWSWADSDGSLHSDWKYINGKWFYFDTEDPLHRMLTGAFQISSGTYYVDESLGMTSNNWVHLPDGNWAWTQSSGAFASGWYNTPNGKTWYFDPSNPYHPALLGEQKIEGKSYYFDEGYGLLRNSWVHHSDGTWSWVDTYGAFQPEWKKIDGRWFYFDPEDEYCRLKTGAFQISSGTYYVDENKGMTSHDWVRLPDGNWAWADWSGAFVSSWFNTPNGKTWYFDPSNPYHPALLGEQSIEGKSYYFDEGYGLARNQWITRPDGVKRWAGPDGVLTGYLSPDNIYTADNGAQPTGTVKLPGLTLHIGSDHKVKTGWVKENDKDYYYLNDGSAASDWVNIQGTWYYFNTNGEKQTGWIHLRSGWYYLGADGKMRTGWIKDDGKDYYLDSNGTMVTGYTTWGSKLYWAGADGAMKEQPCYYPDMYRYAQNYYSATNWLIQIDTTGNRFAVYKGSHGNWVVWYEWQCTTGAPGMWTPHGQFTAGHKGLYFGSGYRCWYYTTISGEYLIHSILYHADGYTVRDGRLGYNGSHGCVRLATENAKWVYDNIPYGTKIVIW